MVTTSQWGTIAGVLPWKVRQAQVAFDLVRQPVLVGVVQDDTERLQTT
jgi:hypothetical protein